MMAVSGCLAALFSVWFVFGAAVGFSCAWLSYRLVGGNGSHPRAITALRIRQDQFEILTRESGWLPARPLPSSSIGAKLTVLALETARHKEPLRLILVDVCFAGRRFTNVDAHTFRRVRTWLRLQSDTSQQFHPQPQARAHSSQRNTGSTPHGPIL